MPIYILYLLFQLIALIAFVWMSFFGIVSKEYVLLLFGGLGVLFSVWLLSFYLNGFNKIDFLENGFHVKKIFFKHKTILYDEIISWQEHYLPRVTFNAISIQTKSAKTIFFSMVNEKQYEELRFQLNIKLKEKEKCRNCH